MGLRYDFYDPNQSFVIHPTEVVKVRLEAPRESADVTKRYAYFPVEGLFDSLMDLVIGMILVHLEGDVLIKDTAESFDGLESGVLFEFYIFPQDRDTNEGCRNALTELRIAIATESIIGSTISISY